MMFGVMMSLMILDQLLVRASADYCPTAYCKNGFGIGYPFYVEGFVNDSNIINCGYKDLSVRCSDSDPQGRPVMNISNHLYFVQNITYKGYTDYYNERISIRLMDVDVDGKECPLPRRNFSFQSTPSLQDSGMWIYLFYNCSSTTTPRDVVQNLPCLEHSGGNTTTKRSFAFFDYQIPKGFNWFGNCEETVKVPTNYSSYDVLSTTNNVSVALKSGFQLLVRTSDCDRCAASGGRCSFNATSGSTSCQCGSEMFPLTCPKGPHPPTHAGPPFNAGPPNNAINAGPPINAGLPIRLKIIIGLSTGLGGGILFILLAVYRNIWLSFLCPWRTKDKTTTNVEVFLENYGDMALQKYKYSDVKKMTNSFKLALGKGAFGSVFKGKLHDGRLVAVKVLNGTKGNGEEFINEVATIGRTNHINVVSLLGFCAEGNKRALVYEFMPNGSLERFIYNNVGVNTPSTPSLGSEMLYQIALGIAKGLEYLHYHCNTRILHFDIKPHNILLDQDFCPKISDFGLAKLCPTRESVISMVGARGTTGYIAPEFSCRNFGGVSHRSDVYSYGMMMLEMIGGRKNIDVTVENISEIYFPHWIYNHLNREIIIDEPKNIKIERPEETFKDETTKKMIIVALWCIQTHPNDRPSVRKVVEMLEGNFEERQMPPNPFQDPPTRFSTSTRYNVCY